MSRVWPPAMERFRSRITEVPSPGGFVDVCWQWDVLRPATGYGDFYDSQAWLVHRWSYTTFVGPIPGGKEIDHLCRNRGCVNPSHLEPVTSGENSRRGYWGTRTHCAHGHEFTPENTRRYRDGKRVCVECKHINGRRYQARRRAVA